MPKYLIEAPHEAETLACARAVQVFLTTGSHFLTNAEWGCADNVHSAWIIVEVENKDEARAILPPAFRADAKITRLTRFKLEAIEATIRKHSAAGSRGGASGG